MNSLKNISINAAKWNFIANFGSYVISFFLSIVLARLLEPYEFGLTGMLSIFTALAIVFINAGLSTALIRLKEANAGDYTTVFYFNIIVSVVIYILFYFFAPLIADFYNEPILINLTRLISLVFLINSFGIIQNTILIKELLFKKQAICYLAGLGFSTIISIVMAFNGYGVYSIVGQAISQAIVTNIAFWIISDWRPLGWVSKKSFKKLWGFGSKILFTNLISQLVDNIDNILIGKIFSVNTLGFYVRAKSSKIIPEQVFTNVLQATVFPILSKVNDDDVAFRNYHLKFYNIAAYVIFPIVAGFMAIAKGFTIVLFTEKWLPSVPLLQIIVLSSISYFLGALFNQTIMAKGQGSLFLKLNVLKKIVGLVSIPVGLLYGLIPFLWALVIISIVNLCLDFYFTGKLLKISMYQYANKMILPFLLSIIMGAGVFSLEFCSIENKYLLLFLQLVFGVIIYSGLSALFRLDEFLYLKEIVLQKINKIHLKK